ncbi:CC chemokine gene family protein [Fowlpox virus]|nr:CC chemokine gene family protein [Fowlpox virus]URH25561.1 CC chemokine gene family protein [Fowlpox virus]URH27925.1 CC chemokine gene family protein [Fowlpox virus]URH28181.1 CC chemokine gene family protein [Fowlpox virus]URH28440.1 CC chemokine gene family protein [Fowlpox virus]
MPLSCETECCMAGKKYDDAAIDRDLCVLLCNLQYLASSNEGIGEILQCCLSSNYTSKTREDLRNCIAKCPPLPDRGCTGECCDLRENVDSLRANNPLGCCNDYTKVSSSSLNEDDVIDCRKSDASCEDRGYLLVRNNGSAVCIPENSKNDNIGFYFGSECSDLSRKG